MKKKGIIMLLAVAMSVLTAQAQRHGHKHEHSFDIEKHHQEQADYFAKELDLTVEEKKAFTPLMHDYVHARFELNKEVRTARRELMRKEDKTSSDYQKVIDLKLNAKVKSAELEKEYYKKLGKVISPEKVWKYERVERKFMQRAVKHHREKRDGDARGRKGRDRK